MSTVAITGVNGFIGQHVLAQCLTAGYEIFGLAGVPSKSLSGETGRDECLSACAKSVVADINDTAALESLFEGADIVIHMAGPPSVAESFSRAAEFVRVHAQGTANAIQVANASSVRRFVYVSSAEVYGQPNTCPVGEDHPLKARSPYGASKIAAEMLVQSMCTSLEMDAVVLRPFSVYGRGQTKSSLLSTILRKADLSKGEPLELWNLKPIRDYCFVDDVANAVVMAAKAKTTGVCVCNVGTSIGTSVEELAKLVLNVLGKEISVVESDGLQRSDANEIYSLVSDSTAAFEYLGWRPTTSLSDGIANTIRTSKEPQS